MIEVLNRLSDRVAELLEEAGWPALRDAPNGTTGKIFLLDAHRVDQFMPPRIVAVPVAGKFGPKNATRGVLTDAQMRAVRNNPPIATESLVFEVRCWGTAPDSAEWPHSGDFEYTRALYHAIFNAAHTIAGGVFVFGDGHWESVAHAGRVGREFVFTLSIDTPITSRMPAPPASGATSPTARPLPNAPSDVAPKVTDAMNLGTPANPGAQSPGCEGD